MSTPNRIYKARVVGGGGSVTYPSKQLLDDPFSAVPGYGDVLMLPPYSLEQLVVLAEKHPVHGAALEQKAMDVVGKDIIYEPLVEDADPEQRDDIQRWLEGLPELETLVEVLHSMQLDYHTTGWGLLEVARDPNGIVRRIYHVPAHTVRATRDNTKLVQVRGGRAVWFKRWGAGLEDVPILAANGRRASSDTSFDKLANEMLVFRKSSRRSTWYGVPNYVSALGHIALAIAARDYNVLFFQNAREPRYVFVVSGLDGQEEEIEALMDELEQSLKVQHAEPHRNLIIPLTGERAQLRIERITAIQNDMHFTRLMELTEKDILIAHRMPPDRVGSVMRGFLGGNVAASINRIYKDAVVAAEQHVLKDRLNRFIRVEYARARGIRPDDVQWGVSFETLDLSDETVDTMNVLNRVKSNAITLNEARSMWGLPARDGMDVTLAEWLAERGKGSAVAEALQLDTDTRLDAMSRTQEAIMARMEQLDEMLTDLLLNEGKEEEEVWGPELR